MNANAPRARNGRYTFADMEQMCRCGRKLGAHLAEAPHPFEDEDGGDICERFRPSGRR